MQFPPTPRIKEIFSLRQALTLQSTTSSSILHQLADSGRSRIANMTAFSQFIPSGLYAPSTSSFAALAVNSVSDVQTPVTAVSMSPADTIVRRNLSGPNGFAAASASEGKKIEMYSNKFYGACALGGIVACGATHTAVTPLDVVKCNMQIDPKAFPSIGAGFRNIIQSQGVRGLFKGWAPTAMGYSAQGACKFGFYEYFKK